MPGGAQEADSGREAATKTCGEEKRKQEKQMTTYFRRMAAGIGLAVAVTAGATTAQAGGTLTLGMTASDIPTSTGAPNQGGEGIRWMGFTSMTRSCTGT